MLPGLPGMAAVERVQLIAAGWLSLQSLLQAVPGFACNWHK